MAASAMCMLLQIHGEATCTTEVCRSNHQKELHGISTLQKNGQPQKILGTSLKEVGQEAAQNNLAQIAAKNQPSYQVQTGEQSTPTNQVTNSTSNDVVMVVSSSEATVSIDLAGVKEFVAGLIEGFVHKNYLTEIEAIVQDLSTRQMTHITHAVEEIATVVQQIPDDLKNCKGMQGDIQKIKTWAQNIDASKTAWNVLKHSVTILKDAKTVNTDFQTTKYFDAGQQVADIAIAVFGAIPSDHPSHRTCHSNSDCGGDSFCCGLGDKLSSGCSFDTCTPKRQTGETCGENAECYSNNCCGIFDWSCKHSTCQ